MALIDIPGLPAIETLKQEGRTIVDQDKGLSLPHKEVAILNLMPMKEQTERQLLRRMSMVEELIHVTFLVTESYTPKHTPKEHLEKFYLYPSQIYDRDFDGLVITGAPLEYIDYEEVAYWEEWKTLLSYAEKHVGSVFFICWAAQAALYYFYGVPKRFFPQKASGVFCHRLVSPSPIAKGMEDPFYVPQSRNTTNWTSEVAAVPQLTIVAEAKETGVYLVTDEENKRILVTGHSEYDPDTLQYEYLRDTGKGLSVPVPTHYFKEGDHPEGDPHTWTPVDTWSAHSVKLWNNWFTYYASMPKGKGEKP